jgi:hypothetical protein
MITLHPPFHWEGSAAQGGCQTSGGAGTSAPAQGSAAEQGSGDDREHHHDLDAADGLAEQGMKHSQGDRGPHRGGADDTSPRRPARIFTQQAPLPPKLPRPSTRQPRRMSATELFSHQRVITHRDRLQ